MSTPDQPQFRTGRIPASSRTYPDRSSCTGTGGEPETCQACQQLVPRCAPRWSRNNERGPRPCAPGSDKSRRPLRRDANGRARSAHGHEWSRAGCLRACGRLERLASGARQLGDEHWARQHHSDWHCHNRVDLEGLVMPAAVSQAAVSRREPVDDEGVAAAEIDAPVRESASSCGQPRPWRRPLRPSPESCTAWTCRPAGFGRTPRSPGCMPGAVASFSSATASPR